MAGAKIDDPAASEKAAHASGNLPRLIQLFARKTTRVAYATGNAVEESVAAKATEIVIGEATAG
jgi:hypothetical protein